MSEFQTGLMISKPIVGLFAKLRHLVIRQLEQVHAGGSSGDPLLLRPGVLDAKGWVQVLRGKVMQMLSSTGFEHNLETQEGWAGATCDKFEQLFLLDLQHLAVRSQILS